VKDADISTSAQLEASLVLSGMRKHAHLRRIAERGFRWPEAVGMVASVLLAVIGLLQIGRLLGVTDFMRSGIVFVVWGLVLAVGFLWGSMQRQQKALIELIERLEQHRS